ncbi:MAG: hypothetical protein ACE5FF_04870 [Saprospiraceae bacterium]
MRNTILSLILLLALPFCATTLHAQYFGRNKPKYEDFDFKVLQTPNFEIYNYLDNPELLRDLAAGAEHWYRLHQAVLADTFKRAISLVSGRSVIAPLP